MLRFFQCFFSPFKLLWNILICLLMVALVFLLVCSCNHYRNLFKQSGDVSPGSVYSEVFAEGARQVVQAVTEVHPEEGVILVFPLDGEFDSHHPQLTEEMITEFQKQPRIQAVLGGSWWKTSWREHLQDVFSFVLGEPKMEIRWMTIPPEDIAQIAEERKFPMFLRGKIMNMCEEVPSVHFQIELWKSADGICQKVLEKTFTIPADSARVSTGNSIHDSRPAMLVWSCLIPLGVVLVWLLVMTPWMFSVLKMESTGANIWMIFLATLSGVAVFYCGTSLYQGVWGVSFGRFLFLALEFVLLLLLSTLWMSFLEKNQR
ncbi:MAG: hypothetical protein Q4E67_06220 [Planctomycetia bacterium]|nr:hypothetical protein [Planctomycetia bacterium]